MRMLRGAILLHGALLRTIALQAILTQEQGPAMTHWKFLDAGS